MSSRAARLFGTDGIRGVANRDLTAELALRIGSAAAEVLLGAPHGVSVLIGRDTRISGPMIESALAAGFASRGADVVMVGVIPTPGVAWLVRNQDADVGCVISASHNAFSYNGIKLFASDGEKLPDDTEREIELKVAGAFDSPNLPVDGSIGRFYSDESRVRHYIEAVAKTFRGSLDGFKIVVDAGHGAAYRIAPEVLASLGAEVVTIGCSPNGCNINDRCGSLFPEKMCRAVAALEADAGLSFDGDADRVVMGAKDGSLVDGDRIMAICGIDMASRGQLPGGRVVSTVMSNVGLENALAAHGLELDRVPEVGDRYVAERMRSTGAAIGGEKSGHIILSDYTTTGDGIVTGLQVLSVMAETGRSLSELAAVVTELPQLLDSVRVRDTSSWQTNTRIGKAIADAEQRMTGRGRVHVRASGTEPIVRVMAEGPDEGELRAIVSGLCRLIADEVGA